MSEKKKPDGSRTIRGFEDLAVFQRAYRASLEIHRLAREFPRGEQSAGGLAGQARRSSRSVCANIAEGFGRKSASDKKRQFTQFLSVAAGSADETRVWLRYAKDLEHLDDETWSRLSGEYQEIARMLAALAKSWR